MYISWVNIVFHYILAGKSEVQNFFGLSPTTENPGFPTLFSNPTGFPTGFPTLFPTNCENDICKALGGNCVMPNQLSHTESREVQNFFGLSPTTENPGFPEDPDFPNGWVPIFYCNQELGCECYVPHNISCENDDCKSLNGKCVMPHMIPPTGYETNSYCNETLGCKCYTLPLTGCNNDSCTEIGGSCFMPEQYVPATYAFQFFCMEDEGCKCYKKICDVILEILDEIEVWIDQIIEKIQALIEDLENATKFFSPAISVVLEYVQAMTEIISNFEDFAYSTNDTIENFDVIKSLIGIFLNDFDNVLQTTSMNANDVDPLNELLNSTMELREIVDMVQLDLSSPGSTNMPISSTTTPTTTSEIPNGCCPLMSVNVQVSGDVAQIYPWLSFGSYKYIGICYNYACWQIENVDETSNYILYKDPTDGYWKIKDDFDYSSEDFNVIQQSNAGWFSCPTDENIDWSYQNDDGDWVSTSSNNQYINITCAGNLISKHKMSIASSQSKDLELFPVFWN